MILNPLIENYLETHHSNHDPILAEIYQETLEKQQGAHMISGAYQGQLLRMISMLLQPKQILELGTFTGYSAYCLAKGLKSDGNLISLEKTEELRYFHEKYLARDNRIKVLYGDALQSLLTLKPIFDLIFIDADKNNYEKYYEKCLNLLNKNGVMLIDNVLWRGQIVTKELNTTTRHQKIITHLQALNEKIAQDSRVESLILPIRDGISLIRKK